MSRLQKTLAFLVESDLLKNHFEDASEKLLGNSEFIDALQLVRGDVILSTYPLKGNEVTIGYPVLRDSIHYFEAMKSLERGRLYFEGPMDLIQGGQGFVGRHPIFKADTVWGFSAAIISTETLLEAVRIGLSGVNETYSYQLAKKQPNGDNSVILFPNNTDYESGQWKKDFIPDGDWYLYVKLNNPYNWSKAAPFALFGILLSFLFAYFVRYLSLQPKRLQEMVDEKTSDLAALNAQLNHQQKELTTINNELEQFAYVASHDLQEPLRMVSSFLMQIEKKYSDSFDERGKQYLYFAVDGANRMRQMIIDLLDFSRAGVISSEKEHFDAASLVEDFISLRKETIKEKSATIRTENLPKLESHKAALTQIFHNLLDNALKYAKPDVPPEILVSGKDLGDYWEFAVKDNGQGIEAEYFKKIFVIFQRLHNKKEVGGTGIGLAIVQKLVEWFDGEVRVSSEHGKGSTFTFTIRK